MGERDAAPTSAIFHAAVLGELRTIPNADDGAARLEEDDIVVGLRMCRPTEGLEK
jgi:hypothetical protein